MDDSVRAEAETIKRDLLLFQYRVLARRLAEIGEALDTWRRSGRLDIRWGSERAAFYQASESRFRKSLEIQECLARVDRLLGVGSNSQS